MMRTLQALAVGLALTVTATVTAPAFWTDHAGMIHIKRAYIPPTDPGAGYHCLDGRRCAGWVNGVVDWAGTRYLFI